MFDRYFKISLKTKMALAATGLFILFIIPGSFLTLWYFERGFKESISTQQFALVSSLADAIDEKLKIAQNSLIAVASIAPPDAFTNANSAQRFLDLHTDLQPIFDNNTVFISMDGKLVAEGRYVAGRRGKDLSYREWYQKTVADAKPYISTPYVSTHSPHHPVIMMTVPIFDSQGRMTGMLAGSVDLQGENFLAKLSRSRVGKNGYLYITDDKRTLIVHPDYSRIMKPAAAPGVNWLFDRAIGGFEGSGETVTSAGVRMLSSFKGLRMTSWIMAANYPVEEAYAPLNKAKNFFIIATIAATSVLLFLTWFIMRHLMSPLGVMTQHLEHMPERSGAERLVKIDSWDEIGILAKTFNKMIESLDRQREELTAQALVLAKEIAEKQRAQEKLVLKQQLLEALNNSLEERIIATVDVLRQKDRMLIQQSRQAAMGEMFDNIAHQWRQPLNNLALIVQALQLSFMLGELCEKEMTEQIDKAMNTIGFMSNTIDDFRNFFRPDKEKVAFNVHPIVTRTLSIIEGSFEKQRVAIDVNVVDDPVIHGYPNEYAQVLLNILINARDAVSGQGSGSARVLITLRKEGGKAVVLIADNAGGIPEQIIDKIFDPYFTTKGPGQGTGIGLFMSKTIIENNMGGRLTVRNTVDGAEFRIEVQMSH